MDHDHDHDHRVKGPKNCWPEGSPQRPHPRDPRPHLGHGAAKQTMPGDDRPYRLTPGPKVLGGFPPTM